MSSLDDVMKGYGAVIDADRPATIADMIDILGGTGHVAELMGVTPRTVQRWRAAETKSAKEQRPGGAARVRPELEKLATDKQMDELREKIARDGLGVHFDGHVQISGYDADRTIDLRIDADSIDDFDERMEAWLSALEKHQWKAAADEFNGMFWDAFIPGIFDRANNNVAITDVYELALDAFTEE